MKMWIRTEDRRERDALVVFKDYCNGCGTRVSFQLIAVIYHRPGEMKLKWEHSNLSVTNGLAKLYKGNIEYSIRTLCEGFKL